MKKYFDTLINNVGRPISGATVTVYNNGTFSLASLYSMDGGSALANPLTSSGIGYFEFYAADGRYDLAVTAIGHDTVNVLDILLDDPEEGLVYYVEASVSAATATTQAGIATTQAAAATAAAVGASAIVLGVSTTLPNLRPSLNLDFANSRSVDPRITFTRSSIATRINHLGVMETVAANVPRLDFDPVTGSCKGLLIEEARTNLFTYSDQISTWTPTAATVSNNAAGIVAPNGLIESDKLVEDSTNATHYVSSAAAAVTTGTVYTISCFAKAGERTVFCLRGAAGYFPTTAWFDLVSGTVTKTTGVVVSTAITQLQNGWYRCSLTVTAIATGAGALTYLFMDNSTIGSGSYLGDGTSGLYIWGAQLEAGAFPTSYIPTVASQVTRDADVASMVGTNFSSWYRHDEGSFSSEFTYGGDLVSSNVFTASNGTTANGIGIIATNGGGQGPFFSVTNGGVSQASVNYGTSAVAGATYKSAAAYKLDDFALSNSGVACVTDAVGTPPTASSALYIGMSGAAASQFGGWIKNLSYYPKRLTNLELQSLSA